MAAAIETSRRLPGLQRDLAAHDRLAGRVLAGRYRLEQRLGAGAMGVVYRAEDRELRRPVAVKILRGVLLDGREAEARFAREAEALAAIRHPAVVTVHDRGDAGEDGPYLVMELLEGVSLARILEEGARRGAADPAHDSTWIARELGAARLPEPSYLRTVVHWAADLASGLAAAHGQGIHHRDVKPSNVFVRADGSPVLLDFGIAACGSQATITRDGAALGTPAYMAPESLEEGRRPGAAVDVYGLAATLYHMLTLRPPYQGTPSQVLTRLATKDPPLARRLRQGLPRDLQAILDRGLARHPSDRYRTAAELEADLRAFLEYRPVAARPLSPVARAWRRLRRSPAFRAGAAVALLAVAGALGAQWRAAWLAGRRAAWLDLWSLVPPNLTVVRPENRRLTEAEAPADVAALLDAAAEVCPEPLPTLLVRAAFRLDHGDPRGAARDMRRVASSVGSPYAQALALRYAALPEEAAGASALDTGALPEPEGGLDRYLAGFHAIRADRHAEARRHLADPALEEYLPAQELLVLYLKGDPHRMYERAVWLEEQLGRQTATTAHRVAAALYLLQRYEKSLEISSEGLALVPLSHALHINAGLATWRSERLDEAREHLEAAIRLKPQFAPPHDHLIRVLMDAGQHDQALTQLAAAPFGTDEQGRYRRLVLQGEIEATRALSRWEAGQQEAAYLAAEQALALFEEAAEYGEAVELSRAAICQGILEGDDGAVAGGLLELLGEQPLKWRRLETLLHWLPEDLDQRGTARVRAYFEALQSTLAAQTAADPTLTAERPR